MRVTESREGESERARWKESESERGEERGEESESERESERARRARVRERESEESETPLSSWRFRAGSPWRERDVARRMGHRCFRAVAWQRCCSVVTPVATVPSSPSQGPSVPAYNVAYNVAAGHCRSSLRVSVAGGVVEEVLQGRPSSRFRSHCSVISEFPPGPVPRFQRVG